MNAPRARANLDSPNRVRRRAALGIAAVLLLTDVAIFATQPRANNTEPISARALQLRLNPNVASAVELELLPRIGPTLAANIIEYRESVADAPAFRTADDLDRVKRIGPVTVELLRPHLVFPETDATPATTPEAP